jgi:pyruvate dehydrogenase E2 component (dihydrolipoamide acetyltransferase)
LRRATEARVSLLKHFMAISVVMPALEMAQETGKLLAWRKNEGESVAKGEPLLEIETDKAVVEIESPGQGILAGVKARVGDVIPVGETIAWLVAPGENPPAEAAHAASSRASTSPAHRVAANPAASSQSSSQSIQISPKARRLAKEHDVDITTVRGSGPGGAITTEDVLAAAQNQTSSAQPTRPATASAPSSVARLMAERMTQSWTTVPHFFITRDVDAGALLEVHKKLAPEIEKARGVRSSLTDYLIALTAQILRKHPVMNSSWTPDGVRPNSDMNVSLAVAVSDGVVAPVIHNADALGIAEIAARRHALSEKARAGRLHPADLAGGTFTISNLGSYKVDSFVALITPPQAAILAAGAISDRVVSVHGQPTVRPMMTLTLSSDHRVVDGARAANFLNDLVEAIQSPANRLR